MNERPYTPGQMDAARAAGVDAPGGRFDGLHAEAKAALAYSANTLRSVRERYRESYADELARWQELRDQLDAVERAARIVGAIYAGGPAGAASAEAAAEAGADDARRRAMLAEVERLGSDLATHRSELTKLELTLRNLEATWLFLERGDASLLDDSTEPASPTEFQMRIVEAQESERARLAQEIHDGPAQALSNAIFQVEYIERVLEQDARLARTELRYLRELLRRDLGDVRNFISRLRPPLLEQLGLDEALRETVEQMTAMSGLAGGTELGAPAGMLRDAEQTVVLRVAQEALQNVRRHAGAASVSVVTRLEDGAWVLEVRDDGRGFDVEAVAARGRRNFGLQFMRERADLIGAAFDVRSRPSGGTVVRLAIPTDKEESR
jgi:two-component system sensor histidine kinase DegS